MEQRDLHGLIRGGVEGGGGVWADLGSGGGAFTRALIELLPEAAIISVDRDAAALEEQRRDFAALYPGRDIRFIAADITAGPELPVMDGVLAANCLHFVRDIAPVLVFLRGRLRPGGRLVVVEYNVTRPNPWVPHPLPFPRWQREAEAAGLVGTRLLASRPSIYHREMYCASSDRPL